MYKTKNELLQEIHSYLSIYPEDTKEFLDIISRSLEAYKETLVNSRNHTASQALLNAGGFLMESKKFVNLKPELKVPQMIDFIFYNFPKGKCTNHSVSERELFQDFKKACMELNILENPRWKDWLKEIKSNEYYNWMKIVLEEN